MCSTIRANKAYRTGRANRPHPCRRAPPFSPVAPAALSRLPLAAAVRATVLPGSLHSDSLRACGRLDRQAQAPVAQLDRALPSEGKGQRFESPRARQILQQLRCFPGTVRRCPVRRCPRNRFARRSRLTSGELRRLSVYPSGCGLNERGAISALFGLLRQAEKVIAGPAAKRPVRTRQNETRPL